MAFPDTVAKGGWRDTRIKEKRSMSGYHFLTDIVFAEEVLEKVGTMDKLCVSGSPLLYRESPPFESKRSFSVRTSA